MRKTLIFIMIFIITISFLGCQNKSKDVFNFDFKIKENYSEKLSEGLSGAFIDFTKDTNSLYGTDFKDMDVEETSKLSSYMYDVITTYKTNPSWNLYEEELLDLMTKQWDTVSQLNILRLDYEVDKETTKYEEKYKGLKESLKANLENAKKYIK